MKFVLVCLGSHKKVPQIACLMVLKVRGPRSRCHQGLFPPKGVREGYVPGDSPLLVDGHLLCMCISGSVFPLFNKVVTHVGLGLTLKISF